MEVGLSLRRARGPGLITQGRGDVLEANWAQGALRFGRLCRDPYRTPSSARCSRHRRRKRERRGRKEEEKRREVAEEKGGRQKKEGKEE